MPQNRDPAGDLSMLVKCLVSVVAGGLIAFTAVVLMDTVADFQFIIICGAHFAFVMVALAVAMVKI